MWEAYGGHLENTYISNLFTCGLPTETLSGLEHWNHLCNLLCVGGQRNGTAHTPALTNVIKIFPLRLPILVYFCSQTFEESTIVRPCVCMQADLAKTQICIELKTVNCKLSDSLYSLLFLPFFYSQEVQYIYLLWKWYRWLLTCWIVYFNLPVNGLTQCTWSHFFSRQWY